MSFIIALRFLSLRSRRAWRALLAGVVVARSKALAEAAASQTLAFLRDRENGSLEAHACDGSYFYPHPVTAGGFSFKSLTNGVATTTAAAIPEPSTYAVIAGGLTLAGACFRRRARATAQT